MFNVDLDAVRAIQGDPHRTTLPGRPMRGHALFGACRDDDLVRASTRMPAETVSPRLRRFVVAESALAPNPMATDPRGTSQTLSIVSIDKVASGSYIGTMQSVGIKVLKNRLSEYIRAAAAGETILVTDRGQVVAELVSPRTPDERTPGERRLADLVRQGLITPPKRILAGPPPRLPIARLDNLVAELAADREDR